MASKSAIIAFAFLSVPAVLASPLFYEERDFDAEKITPPGRNGFGFAHAVMKEQPDKMMSPMFKHIANTVKSNNAHKGNSNDYQQMRINTKIAAMGNPQAKALHDGIKKHQHPRDMDIEIEEREWAVDELD